MTKKSLIPGHFGLQEKRFASRLRRARKRAKMSQKAVSAIAGLATSYISAVENRVANPTLNTCYRLAEAIGIDPADLVTFQTLEDDDPTEPIG